MIIYENIWKYDNIWKIYDNICCDRTPPWFPTTCNMFWYKDFLCCFFHFHFVRISSEFSSGALWQNVLPQDFATNSFVRILLGFRQNLNWSNEIFDEILTIFFGGKMLRQNVLPQGKFHQNPAFWRIFPCGKTFCHNILPQKQFVKVSSTNSFKFRQTWVEVTKSLTKFQRNSHDHFLWQKVWQNGLPQGLPRNLQRKL